MDDPRENLRVKGKAIHNQGSSHLEAACLTLQYLTQGW